MRKVIVKSVKYFSKDDVFWKAKMEKKIVNFYLKCLLPELIDSRHIRGMAIRDVTLESINENISTNLPQHKTLKLKNTPTEAESNIQYKEFGARMQPSELPPRYLDFNEY